MTVVLTLFTVALFLASVLAHEAAHALAMRRNGIAIEELGLGAPFGPRLVLPAGRLPFRLSFSPILIMAYVRPVKKDEEKLEALPYREHAWTSGAGITANLVIGFLLLALARVLNGSSIWMTMAFVGAAGAAWVLRRPLVAYVFPLLSVPMLAFIVYVLVDSLGEPAGIVAMGSTLSSSESLVDAIGMVGLLNVALAILNVIPVFPADGGRIVARIISHVWVKPKLAESFQGWGTSLLLGLMAYVILSDLFYL